MPHLTPTRRSGAWAVVLVCGLIVGLPVGYVLSIGPAYWLAWHRYLPWPYSHLYAPVAWTCENWPAADDAIRRYLDWWVPDR
jgi:hypothetical protein